MTREGQFASYVLGVKLVTPKGELLEISESSHADLLPFVRSHFGLFGVVCEVTLRVFKNEPLHFSSQIFDAESFLALAVQEISKLKASYDQVFGMLFPHKRKLLWECRKFGQQTTLSFRSLLGALDDPLQKKSASVFKDVILPIVKRTKGVAPAIIADLVSLAVVEGAFSLARFTAYNINPCDRGVIYEDNDPDFDFYDWVFPEQRWPAMVRAFLQLSDTFQRERGFVLPLPALIYFIRKDESSLLSRSRNSDMMALDPTYPDPTDATWHAFREAFNVIAMQHGGIPHINKTRGGAIHHFAKAHDADLLRIYLQKRKEFDPNDQFLNAFFATMFAGYL